MNDSYKFFLEALKASLNNESVQWDTITADKWQEVFRLAGKHTVLPLIFESVYQCPAISSLPPQLVMTMKRQVVQEVTKQAMKTFMFLELYKYLCAHGVVPLITKGIVCRSIYPKPDHRPSGDEDLWIPEGQFEKCHQLLLDYGMELSDPKMDIDASYEVAYGKRGTPLYIEVHKSLFPPESDAYGDLNRFFEGAFDHMTELEIEHIKVFTMAPTDHIFYLICHAFKHFLHSGFGIRQVCDMIMFANVYGGEIDWKQLHKQCVQIKADVFTKALFKIGRDYLNLDMIKAGFSKEWTFDDVDESALLEDLLTGGVYGAADLSRLHSSNITLNAVSADKQGKKSGNHVLKTLFPGVKALSGRYKYLKKYPFLLPVAWGSRILHYSKEMKHHDNNSAAESINIGNQRIELLKKYRIIK